MTTSQHPSAAVVRSACALLFVLAVLALLAAPATAQSVGKTWEAGFDVGSANLGGDEDLDLDLRVGGRVGYFVDDRFEIELQVFQADALLDASLRTAMVNGVFQLQPEKTFAPYLLIGGGVAEIEDIDFLGPNDLSDDGSAYQAAIGTRWYFGTDGDMALRLELSSLWTDTDLFDSVQSTSLTAGLSWAFGSR